MAWSLLMTQDPSGEIWEKRANFWYRIWSVFAGGTMVLLGLFFVIMLICCGVVLVNFDWTPDN